ncbi:MAG TPA: helix-turn-helix domain-containing protein [archaeon]|nr:helix-turn-helix domain-containing protein [archaeon]
MGRVLSEVLIREVMPAMRGIIAKKLIEIYGLSQKQAAIKLGTTQPAISQYKRGIRGAKTEIFFKNQRLMDMVESIAKRVSAGELTKETVTIELFRVCEVLISEGMLETS